MELDEKVVDRAVHGDREAFQSLIEETWGLVYLFVQQRVGNSELAKDLTQDTFLQAFDKRETLRQGRSFVSWLLTIAAHKVIDSHRRRGNRPEVQVADLAGAPIVDSRVDPTRAVERDEARQEIEMALQGLDDRYRAVLILRYWSGLTPGQIARLLEEPEGTIRNRIFRAHLRLRDRLDAGREGYLPKTVRPKHR